MSNCVGVDGERILLQMGSMELVNAGQSTCCRIEKRFREVTHFNLFRKASVKFQEVVCLWEWEGTFFFLRRGTTRVRN